MELILLKLGLALLVANCVLLIVLIVRRDSGQSISTLLANLRDGQADQERLFRDELGRSRLESATIAREHRQEINTSFQSLSDAVRGQMAELGQSHTTKLDSFSGQIGNIAEEMGRKLDSSRETVDEVLRSVAVDTRKLQTEFRTEITNAFAALAQTLDSRAAQGMRDQKAQSESTSSALTHALAVSSKSNSDAIEQLRAAVGTELLAIQSDNSTKLELIRNNVERKLSEATTNLTSSIDALSRRTTEAVESLKGSVDLRLASIQNDNSLKLEEMRRTVDEKLQSTLEQRLGESFRIVSERLEQVHAGLGEMRTLASGVGDLKKVLMNIRARGNWGEVQVGTLLEQMLTPDQYSTNVRPNPDSNERVEYAIKLPGKDSAGDPVWLPIDSKFPHQDYERLIASAESGDAEGVIAHATALEENVCAEAKKIREKYVNPPHTTDFAILFLPTEGLFAEILRRPGIVDRTLRERIVLAGPTTLAALLSSLQMGFRSVAIEKRSAEVWEVLGAVKTEFSKFGNALATVEKKLHEASNKLGDVRTRSRVLTRKLRDVQDLPGADSERLLQLGSVSIAAVVDEEAQGPEDVDGGATNVHPG
ncbi:MAG: DNA recombination protein RmuC [Terriglobales bacterium]